MEKVINLPNLSIDDLENTEYLYHGTAVKEVHMNFNLISNIDFNKSNSRCDFGPGFYLTTDEGQARKRAESTYKRLNKKDTSKAVKDKKKSGSLSRAGIYMNKDIKIFTIKYPFCYKKDMTDISPKIFPNVTNDWFEFIHSNRNKNRLRNILDSDHNTDKKYGMVYGYMADGFFEQLDDVFKKKYKELSIVEQQLMIEIFLSKKNRTGNQVSFHQKEAISNCLEDGEIIATSLTRRGR